MKIVFTILAIICMFITCGCYELNQQERTNKSRIAIGCIGSFTFIMIMLFLALAFGR